ncbi:unnamed protein product [Chondrus crispus]|uniref:Integrase catalytic domain-containing protein n=1 Tax=Chondrus crispus TaxID=2769 RepID=R7QSB8_CHOCR|nr:unnamed protein product [Chondrus crispus]CDF40411.1 unnamed protein product [Chondrus crispus]|eukprot:XP_005710705.1 unnamed protein product [Chondrus crispus]
MKKAQEPTTQTELRSFLGMCNVYRRFVANFERTAAPLNALLAKGKPFQLEEFSVEQSKAFSLLKTALISPPILKLPRSNLPVSVDTDVCKRQVGCDLFQTYLDRTRHPVGFWSRSLNPAEKNYSVGEKECLAIIWALQILRPYLERKHFELYTDHQSLKWMMSLTDASGRLARWRLRLLEFDFTIKYRKGAVNCIADAVSRLPTFGECAVESDSDIPCSWVQENSAWMDEDQDDEDVEIELRRDAITSDFNDEGICKVDNEETSYRGGTKMFYTMRRTFYWPSMALECHACVRQCDSCACERVQLRKHSIFLKLFPARRPLEFVPIAILGPLPRSKKGNQYLLVISDRFSKMTRAIPLKSITSMTVARAFVENLIYPYRPPAYLLSDNGGQFASKFFQKICQIMGIGNLFTAAYHPQTNGPVERFNQTILSGIRHYVMEHQKKYDEYCGPLTYAYNTQVHRSTGCIPFELVLSRPPGPVALV